MGTAQRIVPSEPAAPPRARSYCPARISRLLAIPASARKWATGAGAQQDSRIDLRARKRGADESVPLRAWLSIVFLAREEWQPQPKPSPFELTRARACDNCPGTGGRNETLPMGSVRTRFLLVVREGLDPAESPSGISNLLIYIAHLSPEIPVNPRIWHSIWHWSNGRLRR